MENVWFFKNVLSKKYYICHQKAICHLFYCTCCITMFIWNHIMNDIFLTIQQNNVPILILCKWYLFTIYDIFLQQKMAQQVLTTLKEHPDAWTRVDTILEYSSNQQTKYYALQILENVIKTRWKVLPRAQCEGEVKII